MMDLFDQLNEQQIEAVAATEGYVRIIAGAGSGKTKTLTHRYAYLVKAAGIHPGNVLCVTFTNKAAGEMKRRVRALVGDGYDTSLITTYHGFCVRVLREDIGRLFYPQSFPILDEADQKKILEEIYAELEIKLDRASFEKILESIHYLKAHEPYVDRFVTGNFGSPEQDESLEKRIIRRYMEKQKKVFGLDFDDLISFTFEIFDRFPEVLGKWQERLHYIQVDEFQDSSFREMKLIGQLSAVHHNLFVVGDPDQNIYEWRGAAMDNLVKFDEFFPGTQTVFLNRNYRSTGNILAAANTLIGHNRNRIPKELFTTGDRGADVIHLHAKSEGDEGRWMAGEIKKLVARGDCAYRDIAVLYRSGFLSRFVEQSLMAAGVPYELYGSLRFYERMEIRDALAYLKLIVYNDNLAFERVINTPKRMFGKRKMTLLRGLAEQDGLSYYEALVKYIGRPEFQRSGAAQFVEVLETLRKNYREMPLSDVVESVLAQSGYEQYIRENGSMERLDNLAEFKRTALEAERSFGEFYPLEEFLQQAALQSKNDESEEATDKVKLMTIHASKGLEFPVCFVCGLSEGIFPSGRTLEERKDAGLEEERRLCFVALTRAMKRLYLTESEGTSSSASDSGGAQAPRQKRPSRFLFDIGEQNYVRIGTIPKELSEAGNALQAPPSSAARREIGSAVEHPVFGRGTIVGEDRDRGVYQILFEKTNTVKPVGMDYDFDAWKNLDEIRKNALESAKRERKEAVSEPVKPEPAKPEPVQPEPVRDMRTDKPEPVQPEPEQLAMELPEPELSAPAAPEDPLPVTVDEDAVEVPKLKKQAIPEKYRNAEWLQTVDEGEENLWKRSDVPHEGWVCEAIYDLGEPVGICRMCGHQIIRYVHVMRHPQYRRKIGAGCVCAGRMEGNPEAARERETAFKNRQSRLETFLRLPLKRSRNGNEYVKYKNEIITLLRDKYKEGYYKSVFRNVYSMPFSSKEAALMDAFDKMDPPVEV
ncbi:MAG: UvrD-helicase domain-containing protein [Eubacteriales bacterium]